MPLSVKDYNYYCSGVDIKCVPEVGIIAFAIVAGVVAVPLLLVGAFFNALHRIL